MFLWDIRAGEGSQDASSFCGPQNDGHAEDAQLCACQMSE